MIPTPLVQSFVVFLLLFPFVPCKQTTFASTAIVRPVLPGLINPSGTTLRQRIQPPQGYEWTTEPTASFGAWLQQLTLLPHGTPVRNFRGQAITNQSAHVAVLNLDVGAQDLQQCADAIIRLRAEYLFAHQRFSEIGFHFTSGHFLSWNDYKKGLRPVVNGNEVRFANTDNRDTSYRNFRSYLNTVFSYAGTVSLSRETKALEPGAIIRPGYFLVTPGSPGHAVLIIGKAVNRKGKAVYLLAQSFMPAQSVHVLANPFQSAIHPWYELQVGSTVTNTARYVFVPTVIRSFQQ